MTEQTSEAKKIYSVEISAQATALFPTAPDRRRIKRRDGDIGRKLTFSTSLCHHYDFQLSFEAFELTVLGTDNPVFRCLLMAPDQMMTPDQMMMMPDS